MVKDIKKVMKELEKEWTEAEPQDVGGRSAVPNGEYTANLNGAEVQLSKSSERLQVVWDLKIAEGEYEGKQVMKFDGLDNEVSMGWTKGLMKMLGIKIPKTLAGIPAVFETYFEENPGTLVSMTVKTKDEYTNVYINELLKGKAEGTSDKDTKTKSKPDIKKMSMKELRTLIREKDLSIDPDDYDTADDLRLAILEEI